MANKKAERLIELGLHPVLLGRAGDELKRPLLKGWQTAVYSVADVRHWPDEHNIGIRCGLQRNGRSLIVFDFDEEARRIFPAWCAQMSQLFCLPLVMVSSGRGCHLYFYTETPHPGRTLAGRYDLVAGAENGRKRLVKFIETLGSGRQVVAAGNRHPNGQQYQFSRGLRYEDIATLTRTQFQALLLLSQSFDERPYRPQRKPIAPPVTHKGESGHTQNCLTYARTHIGTTEQQEGNGDIRFLGQGGLLVTADGRGWYSFSDETGGGLAELMAWHQAWSKGV